MLYGEKHCDKCDFRLGTQSRGEMPGGLKPGSRSSLVLISSKKVKTFHFKVAFCKAMFKSMCVEKESVVLYRRLCTLLDSILIKIEFTLYEKAELFLHHQ